MLFKNKTLVLLILNAVLTIGAGFGPRPGSYTTKWVILKECIVKVNGSTNINKFVCTVSGYANSDTLTCIVSNGNKNSVVMNGQMALPVFNFDCVNKVMTRDLRKTLKEKLYPTFYIHFISLERYPLLKSTHELVSGQVTIELAGVKKQLGVNYQISMDDRGIVEMKGEQSFYFSDFNMVAPRKMGGVVKANDKLNVEFIIHCRIIVS